MTFDEQLAQLSKNAMKIARREQERIARDLKQIDRAYDRSRNNGPASMKLATLTLHDKAANNPFLRKLVRDLQRLQQ